jgi:hypothetical protein
MEKLKLSHSRQCRSGILLDFDMDRAATAAYGPIRGSWLGFGASVPFVVKVHSDESRVHERQPSAPWSGLLPRQQFSWYGNHTAWWNGLHSLDTESEAEFARQGGVYLELVRLLELGVGLLDTLSQLLWEEQDVGV